MKFQLNSHQIDDPLMLLVQNCNPFSSNHNGNTPLFSDKINIYFTINKHVYE